MIYQFKLIKIFLEKDRLLGTKTPNQIEAFFVKNA